MVETEAKDTNLCTVYSIENSHITFQYLPTDQMLADILTKGLPGPKVKSLVNKLGIY